MFQRVQEISSATALEPQFRATTSADLNPTRMRDVMGRVKVSMHQNIYEADFEYSPQGLRWESFTAGGGSIAHLPGEGGVRLRLGTAAGDITIRQSRPYHRYQPGKTMVMSTAALFGTALVNQVNRIGFFDDANGVFFEQIGADAANPSGMGVVVRSDAGGVITATRVALPDWNGNAQVRAVLDWTRIQMVFVEYAWYGAGSVRWGVMLDGEPHVLHQIGFGNRAGQTKAWCRTGNLPVRYEQRNTGTTTAQNDMTHYGVSVLVEGRSDDQRGFTYAYGTPPAAPMRAVAGGLTRFPLLSVRGRTMGTLEAGNTTGVTLATGALTAGTNTPGSATVTGTPMVAGVYVGRVFNFVKAGVSHVARITANTTSTFTLVDNVTGSATLTATPAVGDTYTVGQVNRGQLLPRRLQLTADVLCTVELIVSTPTAPGQPGPVVLTGAAFASMVSLGSQNSFAERDVSATALTGGEVVYAMTVPANQPVDQAIDQLFPMVNTIRGNLPDVLTVAITTRATLAANVSAQIIAQEAMS